MEKVLGYSCMNRGRESEDGGDEKRRKLARSFERENLGVGKVRAARGSIGKRSDQK
jgi:hypothetical protein